MHKAQISVELVIMASVAMGVLLVAYLVNENLSASWERQKQKLEAGFAANSFALQVGKAVSGGNGTKIRYFNSAMDDVVLMEISENQSVLATTVSGVSATAPLTTRSIRASFGIPVNSEITLENREGIIVVGVPT
ncbi:MAG: hypothetical protein NT051_06745 [Candidatus Micrarchaeota archaeon]|nr:hypothetical protein [Candidatus Micrarchaeota archaeon]